MTQDKQIATTILQQLGGNRFLTMTGSKPLYYEGASITLKLSRNALKAKWLKIALNSMDTYNLSWKAEKRILDKEKTKAFGFKIWDEKVIEVATDSNIYDDQLEEIFQSRTKLYTRL